MLKKCKSAKYTVKILQADSEGTLIPSPKFDTIVKHIAGMYPNIKKIIKRNGQPKALVRWYDMENLFLICSNEWEDAIFIVEKLENHKKYHLLTLYQFLNGSVSSFTVKFTLNAQGDLDKLIKT